MRFDIVLNQFAGLAWTSKRIEMSSDGTPWRPLVHAADIADAFACVLDAPIEAVHDQVLNVGSSDENYRVREIADAVAAVFPDCTVAFGQSSHDGRSYRVSFDKIAERLPGFSCKWTARRGAEQLRGLFAEIGLTPEQFEFRAFRRLAQLQHLRASGELDDQLFWRRTPAAA
jgi:nucleoside-diphosphate-sugar epimerase